MSTDIQTVLVSVAAMGAAAVLLWRVAGPFFARSQAATPCQRCESGSKCDASAKPAEQQLIRIQRRPI